MQFFYYRVAFFTFQIFCVFSKIHITEKILLKAVKNDTCGIFSFICCFFTCSVYCVCQKPNYYNFSPPCRAIFFYRPVATVFVPPPVAKAIYKNKKTVLKAARKTAFCRRLFHRPRAMGDGRWKIRAAGVKSRSRSTVQKQTTFICKISKQTAVKRLLNKYVFQKIKNEKNSKATGTLLFGKFNKKTPLTQIALIFVLLIFLTLICYNI